MLSPQVYWGGMCQEVIACQWEQHKAKTSVGTAHDTLDTSVEKLINTTHALLALAACLSGRLVESIWVQ